MTPLSRRLQTESVSQDLVDCVSAHGIEATQPLHQTSDRHCTDLLDLKGSLHNQTRLVVRIDNHMEGHRPNRRRPRHNNDQPQIRMMQPVIRNNQRRTSKGLLRILRIDPEIDRPDVASNEPTLSAHPNHPPTQHPAADSRPDSRSLLRDLAHQAHREPTTTTRHDQVDEPHRSRPRASSYLAVRRSERSHPAIRWEPATSLSSSKAPSE